MTKTTTEVVGAAGGSIGVTKTVSDRFGRVIEVHEKLQTAPLAWATTTYTYGPDDAVTSVVDPEAVTTTMEHDFAGHRTRITRHGRTWKYTYDRNGNMIAEQVPGSPNPPVTDLAYTTTIAYDDLDRPVSKVIGPRNLTASDQELFGSRTETFTWDYCCNRVGKLTYWKSYAPNATTPTSAHQFSYDAQGNQIAAQHTFNGAGYANLQHEFHRYANLLGGPTSVYYRDFVGGANETTSRTYYDHRGLSSRIDLIRTGQPTEQIAVQTRNVAGLVTKRRTDTAGPMSFVESNWTYDKLGRIKSQIVQKGPGPTQVVRQDLAYFGNDDPSSLTHYLGTTSKHFNFGFDLRHQLTSVSSTTAGYFDATYSYGTGGRFTRAAHAQTISPLPPGTEVSPRDVNYVYGGTDPEQVTALTTISGGTTYASYTYDTAGNQLTRTYPATGESWDYVYDGSDQLRRATKKLNNVIQGSEEYWYSGEGQRIAVVKRDGSGAKAELIYFIGDTQSHHDASGTVTHVYSHLSMGMPVARIDRTGNTSSAVEYQFHGLASNTIAAVAQDGTINASFSYAPFGEVIEATNVGGGSSGVTAHKRRLNDKYEDDLTKLAYYGARYYDKTAISWTQADPLYLRLPDKTSASPRRAALHMFSLNNPLRYLDPDGLDSYDTNPHASTCYPGSRSGTCVIDTGPAVYEPNKSWRSGATVGSNSPKKKSASARVIEVPIPEFQPEDMDLAAKEMELEKRGRAHCESTACTVASGGLFLALAAVIVVMALPESVVAGGIVRASTMGGGGAAAASAFNFVAKSGRKLTEQVTRWQVAFGRKGSEAEFLSHVGRLAERATRAGTVVTGTVGNGPTALQNATIYRVGAEYLVIQSNKIMSYVPNALPNTGVVSEYLKLGGK